MNWRNLGDLTTSDINLDQVSVIDCLDLNHAIVYTRRELEDQINGCARSLLGRGLRTGDCIGILSVNRFEFIVAYMAIMRAGMVAVPVNIKLPQDTIAFILKDCGAEACFVDSANKVRLPNDLPAICLDEPEWADFIDVGHFSPVIPEADQCAMILYTSGSTGRPKGVKLSHEGQIWTLESRYRFRKTYSDERFIIAAPLFHMNALTNMKFALSAQASIVLMPAFSAETFVESIGQHEVTWITSVPSMMARVVREKQLLAKIDTKKVRYIRMGSAPASSQLYGEVREAFPCAAIAGGYGTTETGPIIFGPLPGRPLPDEGGLGWPLPQVEVKLIGESGVESEHGELWVRTPANMIGYLNLPERTSAVLTSDRWYKTGDLFRRDDAGCYYFVGRVDDMFVCGGENIYPSEVESVIEQHPSVVGACIVPVPDELRGQKPVAFVVLRSGTNVSEEEIKEFVLRRAPPYQHPRRVFFVDDLPLNSVNKIDRRGLQERAVKID